MHPRDDSLQLTPDERRHEVAAILAAGLLRLRDRGLLAPAPISENPSNSSQNRLEAVPENPLTVHDG